MICEKSTKYSGKSIFLMLATSFVSVSFAMKATLIESDSRYLTCAQKEEKVLKPLLNNITGKEKRG